jgi:hypothetical protein
MEKCGLYFVVIVYMHLDHDKTYREGVPDISPHALKELTLKQKLFDDKTAVNDF